MELKDIVMLRKKHAEEQMPYWKTEEGLEEFGIDGQEQYNIAKGRAQAFGEILNAIETEWYKEL
jgi:hypothetical protein